MKYVPCDAPGCVSVTVNDCASARCGGVNAVLPLIRIAPPAFCAAAATGARANASAAVQRIVFMHGSFPGQLGRVVRRPSLGDGLERIFRESEQARERFLIADGELRKRFAIDRDAALLQPGHESRVRQPFAASRSVDARNPQRAEIALTPATIAERVRQRVQQRFVCNAIVATTGSTEALDELHDFAAMLDLVDAALYSSHSLPPVA